MCMAAWGTVWTRSRRPGKVTQFRRSSYVAAAEVYAKIIAVLGVR